MLHQFSLQAEINKTSLHLSYVPNTKGEDLSNVSIAERPLFSRDDRSNRHTGAYTEKQLRPHSHCYIQAILLRSLKAAGNVVDETNPFPHTFPLPEDHGGDAGEEHTIDQVDPHTHAIIRRSPITTEEVP